MQHVLVLQHPLNKQKIIPVELAQGLAAEWSAVTIGGVQVGAKAFHFGTQPSLAVTATGFLF